MKSYYSGTQDAVELAAKLAGVEVECHCVICGATSNLQKDEHDGLLYCSNVRPCLERKVNQIVAENSHCPNGGARSLCPVVKDMDDPRDTCAKCGKLDRNGMNENQRETVRNYNNEH
jgi:hypothetical protein